MNRTILIILMLLFPIIMVILALFLWQHITRDMGYRKKTHLMTQVTLAGTIIATIAVIYAVIFNFYEWEKIFKK